MARKEIISKKYVFLILATLTVLFAGLTCAVVGHYTSRDDDIAYLDVISDDLAAMINDSGNARFKKLAKMIDFGHFIIVSDTKSGSVKAHSFSTDSPKRIATDLKKEHNVLGSMRERSEFDTDIGRFEKIEIFKSSTPFFSSFGDIFIFRLLPIVNKIVKCMVRETLNTYGEGNSYIVVSLTEDTVKIITYNEIEDNKYSVEPIEYYVERMGNELSTKKIMKHLMYRLFLINN